MNALDGVNVEEACWKPRDDVNCIWETLAHQNIHNAYHIGQIVLLRKLQGSWDSSQGVS